MGDTLSIFSLLVVRSRAPTIRSSSEIGDGDVAATNNLVASARSSHVVAELNSKVAHRRVHVRCADIGLADACVVEIHLIIIARVSTAALRIRLLLCLQLGVLSLQSVRDSLNARCIATVGHETLLTWPVTLDCPRLIIQLVTVLSVVMCHIQLLFLRGTRTMSIDLWQKILVH